VSLVEQWDGTAWQIIPSPGPKYYPLRGVAAVSPNDVWAVGGERPNPILQHPVTLIEHWNGTQWSQVPSPNPSPMKSALSGNTLSAVVARAANDVWAVGTYDTAQNGQQTLTLHWDGTAWQVIANPVLPSNVSEIQLTGVVALSATDAWAVGWYDPLQTAKTVPLIMHWNGTAWQVVPGPSVVGRLSGIAATGPQDVQAVGYVMTDGIWDRGHPQKWLVERWDGTAWHRVTTPAPTWLYTGDVPGVTADPAGDVWVVGGYLYPPDAYPSDSVYQTLIEHCTA
jgi:hypothetical protein